MPRSLSAQGTPVNKQMELSSIVRENHPPGKPIGLRLRRKVKNMGPTILVTGGASGIGLAIVQALLERGWSAVVADIDPGSLDRARAQLNGDQGLAHFVPLNVTDEEAVLQTVAWCEAAVGPLTGLVNSAGIASDVPCLDTTTALFRRLVEVNLIGSFVVAREVARCMRARGRGSIVNIASVSGMRGNTGRVAYGASKAGVIAMTQVMAVELAPVGIRVNAIAPGPIETPLVRDLHTEQARAAWLNAVPQRRYGAPKEVAAAALFLLDESQSSFVKGQTICVDGGFSAAGSGGV
jgi:NAD(P)-dependent dehydrogenase (short-subunit alcohol dehydrogenase family)